MREKTNNERALFIYEIHNVKTQLVLLMCEVQLKEANGDLLILFSESTSSHDAHNKLETTQGFHTVLHCNMLRALTEGVLRKTSGPAWTRGTRNVTLSVPDTVMVFYYPYNGRVEHKSSTGSVSSRHLRPSVVQCQQVRVFTVHTRLPGQGEGKPRRKTNVESSWSTMSQCFRHTV